MSTLFDYAQTRLAFHLSRVPDAIVRGVTARRPVVIDGQRLELRTQHVLALLERSGRPSLDRLPVADARREYARFPKVFDAPAASVPWVEDRSIPGPAGALPIRIYGPTPRRGRGPRGAPSRPVFVYYHGGGGVIGSLDTHDGLCRSIVRALDCVVVSVEYRLGPEDPFPAGPDDAWHAFVWTVEHAASLGGDPRRVAVGGDSMGGCFAAVVCQRARDEGHARPVAQLMLYPATDRVARTRSRDRFAEGFLLTDSLMKWFMEQYLGGADPHDPAVSPLRHDDLTNLPPAVLVTAGFDPLRDEGHAYAEALRRAGGEVHLSCQEGLIHGFAQMTGAVPAARRAVDAALAQLRAIWTRS